MVKPLVEVYLYGILIIKKQDIYLSILSKKMGYQIQLPLPQVPLDASKGVAASNLLKRIKMESMYEPI